MIIDEVILRLQAIAPQPFALIEGAAELASLTDQPPTTPAVYVFMLDEAAGENLRMDAVLQRVEADFGVLIIVQNVSDATGMAAAGDLEPLKRDVRAALIGWQPASADDAVTYVGGRLVKAKAGYLWWEMTLATSYLVEG